MNIVDLSGPGQVLGRNEVSRSILTAVVVLRAGGSCPARITYRPPNRASCVTEVVQEGAEGPVGTVVLEATEAVAVAEAEDSSPQTSGLPPQSCDHHLLQSGS